MQALNAFFGVPYDRDHFKFRQLIGQTEIVEQRQRRSKLRLTARRVNALWIGPLC